MLPSSQIQSGSAPAQPSHLGLQSIRGLSIKRVFASEAAAALLGSVLYWMLRFHPVSYDIGRHVELHLKSRLDFYQYIFPGYLPIQFLRYGFLSFLAPLKPHQVVALYWGLGWLSFGVFLWAAMKWGKKVFDSIWIGAAVAALIALFGPRYTALFANHPYEIGLHLALASVFFAGGAMPLGAILAACLSTLVHPNLLATAGIAMGVSFLINRKHLWLSAILYCGCWGFYLLTSI